MARQVTSLGDLPLHRWVGRVVQLRRQKGRCYPNHLAQLVALVPGGRRAVVKPYGHRRTEVVPLTVLRPAWAKNPDLAAERSHP